MKKGIDVLTAYNSLPEEAKERINSSLKEDGLTLNVVHLNYLIGDVKETNEIMRLKLREQNEEIHKNANIIMRDCNKWLKEYNK